MAAKKDVKLEGAGRVKRLSFAVLAVQRGGLSQAGANAVISFKSSGLFQKDA